MQYKVRAKYKKDIIKDFYTKLTDGTIESQKPDGLEILHSMKQAKINSNDTVVWYEKCFCDIPLNHERITVYDKYFYEFTPTSVSEIEDDIIGKSFWKYMQNR